MKVHLRNLNTENVFTVKLTGKNYPKFSFKNHLANKTFISSSHKKD